MFVIKFLITLVVAVLTGCATAPNAIRLMDGEREVRSVQVDPVMLSGLPWTKEIESGRFTALLANFPTDPLSWAEWDPLRIRYQAHAVGSDGREYPAYALFAGYIACQPRMFVIVEGLPSPSAEVKVVTLSTLLNRGYTLRGEEVKEFDAAKFQTDVIYRRELVSREGTPTNTVRSVTDLHDSIVANWSVYNTKGGQIVSPLTEQQVKYLAGINPQYSYWEKVIGTARVLISLDYVGTAVGLAFDLLNATQAKSQGFDSGSALSRERQGYNLAVIEALMREGSSSCQALRSSAQR